MTNSTKRLRKKARRKAKNRQPSRRHREGIASRSSRPLKMSEVISHVAEPLVDQFGDAPEDLERIISLTVAAWNLTLFPVENRDEMSAEIMKDHFGDDQEMVSFFQWACNLVAERKRRYYPNLKCFILDVHFTREEDSVYFEVAYSPIGSAGE